MSAENIFVAIVGVIALASGMLVIWLKAVELRRINKQMAAHAEQLKKSESNQQRMDVMAIHIHDIDIRTSRISEDRARVPIASRQSWTKFVTPIRDAVDKHPLGGALCLDLPSTGPKFNQGSRLKFQSGKLNRPHQNKRSTLGR